MNNKIEDEKILTTEIKEAVNTTEEEIKGYDNYKEPQETEFTPEEKEIILNDTNEHRTVLKPQPQHKTFVLDFETGGLNAYTDGICSVCLKESGEERDTYLYYFEPQRGKLYSQGAFDVNGFNLEDLEKIGEQKEMICLKLKQIMGNSCTIIGHNVEFDLKFLMQLFKECKAKLPIIHYIDTLAMAKKHLTKRTKTNNGEVENFKLTTLYKYYFNDFNEDLAHTADYDVFMTEKLYNELVKLE